MVRRWEWDDSLPEPGGVVTPPRGPASVGVALSGHQSGEGAWPRRGCALPSGESRSSAASAASFTGA